MKQITIIGASRGVGLLAVKQALKNGNRVVALSQNLDTLPEDANLTKIKGSATNVADVRNAIAGSDGVIVSIGTAGTKATTLYSDAAHAIVQAYAGASATAPVIVLTGFGAGESGGYNSIVMRILFSLVLKKVYENKTEMERIVAASNLNWVIVRPGRLTDKPFSGKYKQYTKLESSMKIGSIPRADVAHFLVAQAENATALKQYVSLTS